MVETHCCTGNGHCCLAPCKSVRNYGPLTEPKIYIVKFGRTAIPTLNGRISGTKQDFLDPLAPKFLYDRGLLPTLSWKWPLSASFSQTKNTFSGCSWCGFLVRIFPWDRFSSRIFFQYPPKNVTAKFCDLFRWGIFTQPNLTQKSHFVLFNFLFRSLWTEFSVEITFTL